MFYVQKIKHGATLLISPNFSENSIYILFDPGTFVQKKYYDIINEMKNLENLFLFKDLPENEYQYLRPILFKINSHQEWEVLIQSLKSRLYFDQFKSFMFIESIINNLHDLQKHIRFYLTGHLKNGRMVLVRLYDPIVFLQLQHIWSNEDLQKFWQPFTAWHIWDDVENTAITLKKGIHNG